jgi:hypothetical protein
MNKIGHTIKALWILFVLSYIVGVSNLMVWATDNIFFVLVPCIFFGAISLLFFITHYFFKWFNTAKIFKK